MSAFVFVDQLWLQQRTSFSLSLIIRKIVRKSILNHIAMVKTNKKSKYTTRSTVQHRQPSRVSCNQPSRVSCNQPSSLTRPQLFKKLKDIGINVPSAMSTATLRQLAAHNDQAPPASSDINGNSADDDSLRSYPDLNLESDPHLPPAVSALDILPPVKTAPRTYSLFNCQVADYSDSLPVTEYIAPSLRKAIHEGKDVCLAHLLMPPEHSASQYKDNHREFTSLYLKSSDPRLHRTLSLPDFLLAFVRYMNVMTEVHPERRAELTHYLSFVVKLAVQFPPPLFYEYHKHFSRKAAVYSIFSRLHDLAVRDDDLYFQSFAGRRARTCDADLTADFFASSSDSRLRSPLSFRTRRPPVLTSDQREVCFNFNGYRGCSNSACARAHVCLRCLQSHAQKDCRQTSTNSLT